MNLHAVLLRHWLYLLVLVGLMSYNIVLETRHARTVEALNSPVGLGVICICIQAFNDPTDSDC